MINIEGNWLLATIVIIWVLPWKGVALWRAAKLSQKWWFVVLLVLNTLAILEILYIFVFSKSAMKKQNLAEKSISQ